MEGLLDELSKPVWWVSVVVAGFLINLLSAYLKTSLDRFLAHLSARTRRQQTARAEALALRVTKAESSRDWMQFEMHLEIRQRLQSISYLLLALATGALMFLMVGRVAGWLIVPYGLFTAMAAASSFFALQRSNVCSSVIAKAREAQHRTPQKSSNGS